MSDLEPGKARMSPPDPSVEDAVVEASQVPHFENAGWRHEEGDRETWPEELQRFGGQPQVRLYHPVLERYEVVAESQVGQLRSVGWLLAEEADQAKAAQQADALSERTVEELKEEARARDLPVSGSKAELVERIRSHDSQPQEAIEDAGEPADQQGDEE